MCCGGGSSTSRTSTSSSLPGWLENAAKNTLKRAEDAAAIEGTARPDYASLTDQSQFSAAASALEGANPQGYFGGAGEAFQSYADQGGTAHTVATKRIVDEGGALGSIDDYINPFLKGALQPAISDIADAGTRQRMSIADGAHMAGAFGDAAHGVQLSEQRANEIDTVSDLTYGAYADAFREAMGQRAADRDTFLSAGQFNAGQEDLALERLLAGGQALQGLDQATIDAIRTHGSDLLSLAQLEQADEQGRNNAAYDEENWERNQAIDNLNLFISTLAGTPAPVTTTTTTEQPGNNNGLGQILAAGLGAFF